VIRLIRSSLQKIICDLFAVWNIFCSYAIDLMLQTLSGYWKRSLSQMHCLSYLWFCCVWLNVGWTKILYWLNSSVLFIWTDFFSICGFCHVFWCVMSHLFPLSMHCWGLFNSSFHEFELYHTDFAIFCAFNTCVAVWHKLLFDHKGRFHMFLEHLTVNCSVCYTERTCLNLNALNQNIFGN
jgi:hypothetical protein